MNRTFTLVLILMFASIILVMHLAAFEYFFYWKFWWYDLIMHIFGGAIVASIALVFGAPPYVRPVAFAIFIGGIWEIMEYAAGIRVGPNYAYDTTLDVIADLVGAILMCAIVSTWLRKSRSPLHAEHVESRDQTSL